MTSGKNMTDEEFREYVVKWMNDVLWYLMDIWSNTNR